MQTHLMPDFHNCCDFRSWDLKVSI